MKTRSELVACRRGKILATGLKILKIAFPRTQPKVDSQRERGKEHFMQIYSRKNKT